MSEFEQAWRCVECGCLWRVNPPTEVQPHGSVSLYGAAQAPLPCCDNVPGVLEEIVIRRTGRVAPPDAMDERVFVDWAVAKDL